MNLSKKCKSKKQEKSWSCTLEAILALTSYTSGLNNIWMLPYMVYKYGGGAFLLIYAISKIVFSRHLVNFELSMGQFSSSGTIVTFRNLAKAWKGIGIAQWIINAIFISYQSFITSIFAFYFIQSLKKTPPWLKCKEDSFNCIEKNVSHKFSTGSEIYFRNCIIGQHERLSSNHFNYQICISLLIIWFMVFLVFILGFKSYSKFIYVTLISNLSIIGLLIFIFMQRGLNDVMKNFQAKWKKLLSAQTWYFALVGSFVTQGIGTGVILTHGSYNGIHFDAPKISFFATLVNFLMGISYCCLLFGARSNIEGIGIYIIFIDYVEAYNDKSFTSKIILNLSFLIFTIIMFGSLIGSTFVILKNFMDFLPILKNWQVAGIIVTCGYFTSIMYTTNKGLIILNYLEVYCNIGIAFYIAIIEVFAVIYFYGMQNWCWDNEFLFRQITLSWFMRWILVITIPVLLAILCIVSTIDKNTFNNFQLNLDLKWLGILLSVIVLSPILITIIIATYKQRNHKRQSVFRNIFDFSHWLPKKIENAEKLEYLRIIHIQAYPFKEKNNLQRTFICLVEKL